LVTSLRLTSLGLSGGLAIGGGLGRLLLRAGLGEALCSILSFDLALARCGRLRLHCGPITGLRWGVGLLNGLLMLQRLLPLGGG